MSGICQGRSLLGTISASSRWAVRRAQSRSVQLVVLIMLVGALLRIVAIDSVPLWGDEALTLLIVKWPVGPLMLQTVDPTPGLYYLLHKVFVPDTANVAEIRSISLVCGIALIPLSAVFGSILGGRNAGIWNAGLVALSAPLIDYSQEARAYALLTLLIMVSAVGLLLTMRTIDRSARFDARRAAIFAASAVLAFYTHFVALFWIGPAVVVMIFKAHRFNSKAVWQGTRITLLAMILLSMPGAVRLVASLAIGVRFEWLPQATPMQFLAMLGEQVLPLGRWSPRPSEPGSVVSVLALLAAVIIGSLVRRRSTDRSHGWCGAYPDGAPILGIFLILPFGLWLFGAFAKPIFMPRTMLWAVPGYITMIALFLDQLNHCWMRVSIGLAYAASLAVSGTIRDDRQDTRPFQRDIQRLQQRGDVLMVCRTWRAPELRHAAIVPLPMPLLVPVDHDIALIETKFGDAPDWEDRFGWIVRRPVPEPQRRLISTSGRVWLLASLCEQHDWVIINGWLGPGRWVRLREDPPAALLPVVLWRFDPASPPRRRAVLDYSGGYPDVEPGGTTGDQNHRQRSPDYHDHARGDAHADLSASARRQAGRRPNDPQSLLRSRSLGSDSGGHARCGRVGQTSKGSECSGGGLPTNHAGRLDPVRIFQGES